MTTAAKQGKSQFIVAWSNPGNEDLLKAEISTRFKDWTPSFLCKGMVSFKNTGLQMTTNALADLRLAFARRLGIFQKKITSEEWDDFCKMAVTPVQCYLPEGKNQSPLLNKSGRCLLSPLGPSWPQGQILQAIFLGKEIWLVDVHLKEHHIATPGALLPLDLPEEIPSRAYHKMAQSFKINEQDWQTVIELGAAPGGITYALLEQGMNVHAVDNGQLAECPLFQESRAHKKLTHYALSTQQFLEKNIAIKQVDAIVSDMNLPCEQNLHLTLEVASKYEARELWITLKMPVPKLALKLKVLEQGVRDWGAREVYWCQLSAHRRETLLLARRI